MKPVSRTFKPVAEVTAQEWELVRAQARAVLGSDEKVVKSIQKRERIALWRCEDQLVGTATVDITPAEIGGRRVVMLYTGNTWIHPAYRRRNWIQRIGARSVIISKRRYPGRPAYWVFGSNNYPSYLLMPRNFATFWPRHDRPTPPWDLELQRLAAERYYDHRFSGPYGVVPAAGLSSFPEGETAPPKELAADPHLRFYQSVNPDFRRGSRLLCTVPLDLSNLLSMGWRGVLRAARRGAGR